jgi:hypothetical protein
MGVAGMPGLSEAEEGAALVVRDLSGIGMPFGGLFLTKVAIVMGSPVPIGEANAFFMLYYAFFI